MTVSELVSFFDAKFASMQQGELAIQYWYAWLASVGLIEIAGDPLDGANMQDAILDALTNFGPCVFIPSPLMPVTETVCLIAVPLTWIENKQI